jgi:hypothetical protein
MNVTNIRCDLKPHRKTWITREIFRDWSVGRTFCQKRKYCAEKNIDFRVLLIQGNAGAHVRLYENVK